MSAPHQMLSIAILVGTVLLLAGCEVQRNVTVDTSPTGATIWIDDEIIGPAPQRVTVPKTGQTNVTACCPGYDRASIVVSANTIPPERQTTIKLKRQRSLSLTCRTFPEGAAVFLNGEFRGTTPIELTDLAPGTAEITFRMEGREPASRTTELDPATPAQTVKATLKSVTEGYYLQQIETNRQELANYVDLAHHYMLEKRFPDAMEIFEKGIELVFDHAHISASRLWSEVGRVTERQYNYGDDDDVKKACRLLRDMLANVIDGKPRGENRLYLFATYVVVLDKLSERRKAQQYFEKVWSEFPRNKHLERLRRRYRFSTY